MNIFFLTLVIFVLVYLLLNWFAKTSSKKISKGIRSITIILAAVFALVMVYAGRFIFSLPFLLMILPLIKTKAGLSLLQLLRIWSLLRVLKNSGRFNFNNINQNLNAQSISLEEAYRILKNTQILEKNNFYPKRVLSCLCAFLFSLQTQTKKREKNVLSYKRWCLDSRGR